MQVQPKVLIPRQGSKRSDPPPSERAPETSEHALEPSEGQYRALFDRFPHPAWVLDRATLRFLAANEAAVDRFGYTREEFLTMSYPDIHFAEDATEVRQKLGEHSDSRGASHARQRVKSGSMVRVHLLRRPVPFNRAP